LVLRRCAVASVVRLAVGRKVPAVLPEQVALQVPVLLPPVAEDLARVCRLHLHLLQALPLPAEHRYQVSRR
jgi:hypothetical protein